MAKHNEIGRIGEDIAVKWLKTKNFDVTERNYLKKLGEIDIVARETNKVHFIEVKSVSYETREALQYAVSHGTWRPEENVHKSKQIRLMRAMELWIEENAYSGLFQIDIVAIRMVPREKYAQCSIIENVVFE